MMQGKTSSRVSLVKGDNRYVNVRKALELIQEDIHISDARRILIKPNLTSVTRQLAATHLDAVRAVLDFLKERTSAQFIIAEGSGTGTAGTFSGFENFGYLPLKERYNLSFVDLNTDEGIPVEILNSRLKPFKAKVAKTVVDAKYRISVCPPKTHDCVVFTGALKNLLVGSLLRREHLLQGRVSALVNRMQLILPPHSWLTKFTFQLGKLGSNDKIKIHQGYPAMNLNLYKLAKFVAPHLSVVDGFEAMEGDGPVVGEEVDLRVAVASTDFVAADTVAAKLLGFDLRQIGYLAYCHQGGLGEGDISKIEILGERIESCVGHFKPHHSFKEQLKWQISEPERFL
jgi:uncharacterized protein (DUF362 family)